MPDMWERARVRHESTPVPEELEFAVASALRAGQRRLRGRRALRRSCLLYTSPSPRDS